MVQVVHIHDKKNIIDFSNINCEKFNNTYMYYNTVI